MIYLVLLTGPVGLAVALYGHHPRTRYLGGLVAGAALLLAMMIPEAW